MAIKKIITFLTLLLIMAPIAPKIAFSQTASDLESESSDLLASQKMIINIENMPNYRRVMRETIITLKRFAKERNPDFTIFVKEGTDLFVRGKWENQYQQLKNAERGLTNIDDLLDEQSRALPAVGLPNRNYLRAVDAVIFENHYCGERKIDPFAKAAITNFRIPIFAIEKCETAAMAMNAINDLKKKKIVTFPEINAAYKIEDAETKSKKRRLLRKNKPKHKHADEYSTIPKKVYNDLNADNIMSTNDVKNMLFNINTTKFRKKQEWLNAVQATNYDMIVVSPFFNGNDALTADDIYSLQFKKIGAKRLVIAYLNISTANDTLPYWKDHWYLGNPSWLRSMVPNSEGELIVDYWHPEWRSILGRYFNNFITLGFDGVVIDGLDNHKFFEDLTPIE